MYLVNNGQDQQLYEEFIDIYYDTQPIIDKRFENGGYEISLTHEVGLFYNNFAPYLDATTIANEANNEFLDLFTRFVYFYGTCYPHLIKKGIKPTQTI